MYANFGDEILWRGRMLAFSYVIRATLFEFGFWIALLYLAVLYSSHWEGGPFVVGLTMAIRMVAGYWEDWNRVKRAEKATNEYIDKVPLLRL
jgi:hypothetical protein